MNLLCTHCGSENLVGEIRRHLLGDVVMKVVCIDCGTEYCAPFETAMNTKIECPFKKVESAFDGIEKTMKVSYKDTTTGERATLISREENGLRMTRFYHDEVINQMG